MRFMLLVKASKDSEAGVMPSETHLAEMATFNEQMVQTGVMLSGDGLHPSAKGARVRFAAGKPTVIDGPFAETKELVAGYWMIQVKSKQEALEWARRVPFEDGEIEVRQVFELEDFAPGDAIDHHARLREQLERK
jgi:hypothetical protein